MNVRRGNESQQHRALKRQVGEALEAQGLIVAYEHMLCDLVAFDLIAGLLFGFEIERSERNVVHNVTRDLATGCDHVFIITPNARVAERVQGRITARLPGTLRRQASLLTALSSEAELSRVLESEMARAQRVPGLIRCAAQ